MQKNYGFCLGNFQSGNCIKIQRKYGGDYLKKLPSRYWMHFGGRALKTFVDVFGIRPHRGCQIGDRGDALLQVVL